VVVLTDGDETGGAKGEALKKMIVGFNAQRKAKNPGFITPVGMVFMGASLQGNGQNLHDNYPCRVNIGAETADAYLQALVQISLMQVKGELDGDLSPFITVGDDSQGLAQQVATAVMMGSSRDNMLYSRERPLTPSLVKRGNGEAEGSSVNGGIDISADVKMQIKGKGADIDFAAVNIDETTFAGFTFEFVE
jgi:hypothetical protein